MRRTQIYLTDEQGARVAELATARATTKAAVIRDFVDRGLAHDEREAGARSAILATAGIWADHPDVPHRGTRAPRRLLAAGAGESGRQDVSERIEEILRAEVGASR